MVTLGKLQLTQTTSMKNSTIPILQKKLGICVVAPQVNLYHCHLDIQYLNFAFHCNSCFVQFQSSVALVCLWLHTQLPKLLHCFNSYLFLGLSSYLFLGLLLGFFTRISCLFFSSFNSISFLFGCGSRQLHSFMLLCLSLFSLLFYYRVLSRGLHVFPIECCIRP